MCRFENYYFFAESVGRRLPGASAAAIAAGGAAALTPAARTGASSAAPEDGDGKDAAASSSSPSLSPVHELVRLVGEAERRYEDTLQGYLFWNFKYEFETLAGFFAGVETLVSSRGVADVHIHEPKERLLAVLKDHASWKVCG